MLRAASILALFPTLAAAASASAAVVPLRHTPAVAGTAVAGDRVVVATQRAHQAWLLALPAAGGAPVVLRQDPGDATHRPNWTGLAAHGDRIAVATGPEDWAIDPPDHGEVLVSAGGAPLTTLLTRPADDPLGDVTVPYVDGDAVLVESDRVEESPTLVAYPRAGAPFGVALPAGSTPADVAGGRVAALAPRPGGTASDPWTRIVVLDWRTGAEVRTIRVGEGVFPSDVALRADGAVAWVGRDRRLHVTLPGAEPRALFATAPDHALMSPVFAGDDVALVESSVTGRQIVAVPAGAGGTPRRVGPRGWDVDRLSSDGSRLAWTADGCVVTALVTDGPAASLPAGPCARTQARVVAPATVTVPAAPHRIPIAVGCIAAPGAGCRGVLLLRRHGIELGRAPFSGVPVGGRRHLEVRLTAHGARILRRALHGDGVVRVRARAVSVDPAGRRSAGTCGCLVLERRRATASSSGGHGNARSEVSPDFLSVPASSRYAG